MRYPKTYVVFDFETTGLDHLKDKVTEIGALKVENGVEVDRLNILIKWPDVEISEKISELTGITNELIAAEGIDPEAAIEKFRMFIAGHILIGHNIYNFDLKFLDQLLHPKGDLWRWWMDNFIDTAVHVKAKKIDHDRRFNQSYEDWAAEVMETRAFGIKFNVGLCCDELGIDKSIGQHRAMNDVILTNEIYKKICL